MTKAKPSNEVLEAAIAELLLKADDLTVNIRGKHYVTVASRIAIARKHFGTRMALQTQIIDNTENRVVMRTQVFIDGELVSVGTAEEFRAASAINKTSALENCETSSVGRALGLLGLTNDAIASAEEVKQAVDVSLVHNSPADDSPLVTVDSLRELFNSASHVEGLKAIVSEPDVRTFLIDLKGRDLALFNAITKDYNDQQKILTKGKNKNGK